MNKNLEKTPASNYPRVKEINSIELIKKTPDTPWQFTWKNKVKQFSNYYEAREFIVLESERSDRFLDLQIAKEIFNNQTTLIEDVNDLNNKNFSVKMILNHKESKSVVKIPEYSRNLHDLYKLINYCQKRGLLVSIFPTGNSFMITLAKDNKIKEIECSFKNLAKNCSQEILAFWKQFKKKSPTEI